MRDGRTCGTCDCIPSDCALACGGTPERRPGGGGGRECAGDVGSVCEHSLGLSREANVVLRNAFTTARRI